MVSGHMFIRGGAPALTSTDANEHEDPIAAGRVYFIGAQHTYTATIGTGGRYVTHLPAGRYTVKGSTPHIKIYTAEGGTVRFTCFADQLTVRAGSAQVIDLGCPVK